MDSCEEEKEAETEEKEADTEAETLGIPGHAVQTEGGSRHLWSAPTSDSSDCGGLPQQRPLMAWEDARRLARDLVNSSAFHTRLACRTDFPAGRWCELAVGDPGECCWEEATLVRIEPCITAAALKARLLARAPPGSALFIEVEAAWGLVQEEDVEDEDLPAEGNLRAKAEPPPGVSADQAALERMVCHWMQHSDDAALAPDDDATLAPDDDAAAAFAAGVSRAGSDTGGGGGGGGGRSSGGTPLSAATAGSVDDGHISGHASAKAGSDRGSEGRHKLGPSYSDGLGSTFLMPRYIH